MPSTAGVDVMRRKAANFLAGLFQLRLLLLRPSSAGSLSGARRSRIRHRGGGLPPPAAVAVHQVVHVAGSVRRRRLHPIASSRARARRAVAPCGAAPALARGRRRPQTPAVRQRVHQRPRVRAAVAQLARRRSPSRRCLLSGVSSSVLLENRGCQSRWATNY